MDLLYVIVIKTNTKTTTIMKLKNLPEGQYTHIKSTYISLIDGMGCTCDNCGRLIANLVTVKNEGENKQYIIGQDCAKTLFSEEENKSIDRAIKAEKRRVEQAPKIAEKAKRNAALNELMRESDKAGISNANINSDWAKNTWNNLLAEAELKHGIYITFKR